MFIFPKKKSQTLAKIIHTSTGSVSQLSGWTISVRKSSRRDGDLMTHFNKIAEEIRRIKPFNIYYYLVLRKLTYIK